jgi:hypothetical protein
MPSLLKRSIKKMIRKTKKMKLKTIPSEFWKAQWQAILYLLKFGRYNVNFEQVKNLKIHYEKSI